MFILYYFLLTRLFLFLLCVYCYSKYSYSQLYCSFNIFFIIILLSDLKSILLGSVYFLFDFNQHVEVKILLQNKSLFSYNREYLYFDFFIESNFSIIIFVCTCFWFIHWISYYDHQSIKRQLVTFFIYFYMAIQL